MANRRMFSLDVVDTDIFLDMPASSQNLYFHLGMRADDDGFISSPKKITKLVNCGEDDLKVLISKGFIIPFDSGVVVIRHWKQNNYIQADRRKDTIYQNEIRTLRINGGVYEPYTECIQSVSDMKAQYSIDKVSTDKKNNMVNDVDRICALLNEAKAKAGSRGRLKAKGAEWHIKEILNAGVSMDVIKAEAEKVAQYGKDIDWYSFKGMFIGSEKGGIS